MNEEIFMEKAFQKAKEALNCGEVPIGCTFVYNEQIIASGRNTVNDTQNATRHAEINAIDELLEWCKYNNQPLASVTEECTVYVNVEPCAMCAAAMHQIGIRNIVYGCDNDKFGGCGSVVDVQKISYPLLHLNINKGIRKDEAISLLQQFYEGENPNAPVSKARKKPKNKV